MTKIEDIEKAVEQLSPADPAKFRAWFEEFVARLFDAKIERDAKAGKLDKLMAMRVPIVMRHAAKSSRKVHATP
jgi:hypothetical protein